MNIPVWLTIAIAIMVIGFGILRIRIARKTDEQEALSNQRRGLYKMSRKTHLIIGSLYLVLGGLLLATSFGWNPFGGMFGGETTAPTKDTAPTKGPIPIDQLPTQK